MPFSSRPRSLARLAALLLTAAPASLYSARAAPAVDFAQQIKPLLARRCFACHGPTVSEGGLRLDRPDAALAELDSGLHAIVPGDTAASELVARVSATDDSLRMPPEGKPLAPEEVALFRRWIAAGAPWQKHWAFIPPAPQQPPAVRDQSWPQNPIDAFILAKLEEAGLSPARRADRRTLARRAYFNLTGLPPTPQQLEKFLADQSPDAWPRLIDELLASPHYGEHWARHWLDLVRYAETNSFERDGAKPFAWKYRDYVIRAFNDDKPYDQFVREQLAGDELEPPADDAVIATGYYRLGIWDDEPADPLQARYDAWDDLVSTTSQTFLGLTIGCARCHDHKIDPISQADYYSFLAFFADVTPYADVHERDPARYSLWDMSSPDQRRRRAELNEKIDAVRQELRAMEDAGIARMSPAEQEIAQTPDRAALLNDKLQSYLNVSEWQLYEDAKRRLEAANGELRDLPAPEAALALARCEPRPEPTHIMLRGNPHVPGEVVPPRFPALFGDAPPEIPQPPADARSAGRRRMLAQWIASPQNMLAARVIVNRVWQHHFGRGIVRSPNNFGELGVPPTHPELLDWLALWLIEHQWRLKPLHRLIMTASAYQMSSATDQRALAADPTNDLFWRFDIRRLSAEETRDALIVASGQFNPQMFGPSIYPKLSAEVLATQSRPGDGWGESSEPDQARRSVYIFVKRSLLTPLLTAFDFPDVDAPCEARFVTTQPGQALAMLNGQFANDSARRLAERVAQEAGPDPRAQVARALELALLRPPAEEEISEGLQLLSTIQQKHNRDQQEALRCWCLTLQNLNEFLYLD
ncbi:MAG: PSD1 domain-containing protein [Pirellulales bacterium]|nr:PSD1 domain-containing protein [Pirellulales bacterium]